ncbi:MAG: citrate lyase holo-[acyl-carrier protein] synthase [Deltaproteobacteria bacterium]|jgi:holo-ACP synthase CitX|nr:citrate lyase holo-[acyl-carrier protein] synthase [Deltaproteobacteria bacterium]
MQYAILEAREQRWRLKQELARRFGACVCSLCLNIPGPDKNPPGAEQAFALLQAALRRAHARAVTRTLRNACCAAIMHEITGQGADGSYWLMASPLPGFTLKHMAVRLEREHPLGRLADIDVLTHTCEPVSRADLDVPPRACFLCGEPAAFCRRKQHHPQETLMAFIGAMLQSVSPRWDTDA